MYLRYLEILITITLPSLVYGITVERLENLKIYYEEHTQTEISEEYFRVQLSNPCQLLMKNVWELEAHGPDRIRVNSEIMTGDTSENNGYRLIVDDSTTIDIPAIVKCVTTFRNNGRSVPLERTTAFVYYLTMYKEVNDTYWFERVTISERRDELKTTFALEDSEIIDYTLESYQNSNNKERKPIINWFNNHNRKKKAIQKCENMSAFGELSEKKRPVFWKILDGKVDVEPFILRVTKTIEVRVRGIIQCKVEVKETADAKPIIKYRYFFMAKHDKNNVTNSVFTYMFGPITIKGKPERIFALKDEFLK